MLCCNLSSTDTDTGTKKGKIKITKNGYGLDLAKNIYK